MPNFTKAIQDHTNVKHVIMSQLWLRMIWPYTLELHLSVVNVRHNFLIFWHNFILILGSYLELLLLV